MSSDSVPVVILGAGLTGMSTAHHLGARGVDHRIFERLAHAGGHAITVEDQGFRFDRTGHLLHLRNPKIRDLVLGWLDDQVVWIERRSVVWSHGVYTRYPFQANTLGLPPQAAYECLLGFVQARLATPEREPRNFEEFCLRHFGEGISRHFMIPYNCRLWGVHPREITADWCARFVPIPTLEDVVAGAVGLGDRELGYNVRFAYPKLGIGELSGAMARDLPHIELGRSPSAIDSSHRELNFENGQRVAYRALVSTAPLDKLCALITDLPDEVREAASRLRCNHLYYLDAALNVPAQKPFHWVYVPEERYPFYRVGCYSNFSKHMAPASKSCLYIELADREPPDMSTLLPRVTEGLTEMGFIRKPSDIEFVRERRIDYAYVIFDHSYFASLDTIQRYLQSHSIVSTGRYGGWNYSSMEDALIFGQDAANDVLELLE